MDYNMDPLSSMLLGDLELFPECTLVNGLDKSGPLGLFRDHECQPDGSSTSSTPSLTDDVFPDWLDLKMDMALLEGLETPDVLDDLLLGEVTAGQSLDILPALQMDTKTYTNPLDLDHLSHPQLVNTESSRLVSSFLNAVPDLQTSPPSSPDWLVPDITFCSQTSFSSQISEPSSPDYVVKSVCSSPAPAQDVAPTPMASVVPSVSVVLTAETSVASPALPLDGFLSVPFLFESEGVYIQMIQPSVTQPEASTPPSTPPPPPSTPPPLLAAKAKRNKIKATRNLRAKLSSPEGDSDDTGNYFPGPVSKKERKRKQNKDAALRYRMKKRLETDVMAEEENELLEENKKLKEEAQQLSKELGYLKNLMREMFKVKGLL